MLFRSPYLKEPHEIRSSWRSDIVCRFLRCLVLAMLCGTDSVLESAVMGQDLHCSIPYHKNQGVVIAVSPAAQLVLYQAEDYLLKKIM